MVVIEGEREGLWKVPESSVVDSRGRTCRPQGMEAEAQMLEVMEGMFAMVSTARCWWRQQQVASLRSRSHKACGSCTEWQQKELKALCWIQLTPSSSIQCRQDTGSYKWDM